jgi:two-component system, OmpR family, osmolarity sensor histidine kinase EnvZ
MSGLSKGHLARTVALFALVPILGELVWVAVETRVLAEPLRPGYETELATYVKLTRAALVSMPRNARPAFLQEVNSRSEVRLLPSEPPYGEAMAPAGALPARLTTRLRSRAGNDVDGRMGNTNTWVRFVAGGRPYWLVIPADRVPPPLRARWLASTLIAALLSSGCAFIFIAQLNRRLRPVGEAARAIGRGETPARLAIEGPAEVQELRRCFNHMSQALQRLDAERRLMLAGIAHDVRTRLVRLQLNVELSLREMAGARADAMVNDIEEVDAMLTQFLELARTEADESPQSCDLNAIVAGICARYRLSGHDVRSVLGHVGLPELREVAVRRLITNLVDNGLRYGEKEVEVATSRTGAHIVVTVSDRGPGIRTVDPDALIKPFAREQAVHGKPGTGLGLTVVDRIARAHGGAVKLMNRPEGGLLVVVTLAAG